MTHKKNILLTIVALAAASLFISSCKKEEDKDDHTANTATITIDSPVSGAFYNTNDTVKIKATLTAAETLHGCDIFIRDKADNSSLFIDDIHAHDTTISIDTFWVNTLSGDTTSLELEIITTLDHDGNTQGKKVSFKALP